MSSPDFASHYKTLLLQPGCSLSEVKSSFRALTQKFHPDQFACDPDKYNHALEQQKKLNAAYAALTEFFSSGCPAEQPAPAQTKKPAAPEPVKPENLRKSMVEQLYEQGRKYESDKDFDDAICCYKQAARIGSASACFRLGCIYMRESHLDQNRAVEFFRQASSLGHVAAMFNLALMYEKGLGVRRDPRMAIDLFSRAAAAGDQQAKRHLQQLNASFNKRPEPAGVGVGDGPAKRTQN